MAGAAAAIFEVCLAVWVAEFALPVGAPGLLGAVAVVFLVGPAPGLAGAAGRLAMRVRYPRNAHRLRPLAAGAVGPGAAELQGAALLENDALVLAAAVASGGRVALA